MIRKVARLRGKTLVFRNAAVADAAFILALRTDPHKGAFLSHTSDQLAVQENWLRAYAGSENQAYFIIESLDGAPLGTVRLYDARADSFCWGSWILVHGAPQSAAIESTLMVYDYAINHLGFSGAHFDVRKGNESVWRFHERFGAVRVAETAEDYFYEISLSHINKAMLRFQKFLPEKTSCSNEAS